MPLFLLLAGCLTATSFHDRYAEAACTWWYACGEGDSPPLGVDCEDPSAEPFDDCTLDVGVAKTCLDGVEAAAASDECAEGDGGRPTWESACFTNTGERRFCK